jgi:hypothetical protein
MNMFTKPKEDLAALTAAASVDEKRLASLRAKLSSFEPEWSKLQERCEYLAALIGGMLGTYATAVVEGFWNDRDGRLRKELGEAVAARDRLTTAISGEIKALAEKVTRRQSAANGVFQAWSFTAGTAPAASPELGARILKARQEVGDLRTLGEILDGIERVANVASENVDLPIFPHAKLVAAIEAAS